MSTLGSPGVSWRKGGSLIGTGASSWTPAALGASLLAWWDASAGVTEVAGAVSAWADSVAALTLLQGTGGAQPVYSATSFKNAPGITFDGTADFLEVAATTGLPTGANPCEIWGLVDQTALAADATSRSAFAYGSGNSQRLIQRRVLTSVNRGSTLVGDGAASVQPADLTVNLSGRHVLRGIIAATTAGISVDGRPATSLAVVPATTTTRTRIGANASTTAAAFWQGVIASILVTAALTDQQAAQLTTYLAQRAF